MCVAVIGGMDRLGSHYRREAERSGVELKVFNRLEGHFAPRLKNVDAVVIFTNKVSHRARHQALDVARHRNIPVIQHHTCGVCTLRECLNRLVNQEGETQK